jgi:hypothetical protein
LLRFFLDRLFDGINSIFWTMHYSCISPQVFVGPDDFGQIGIGPFDSGDIGQPEIGNADVRRADFCVMETGRMKANAEKAGFRQVGPRTICLAEVGLG